MALLIEGVRLSIIIAASFDMPLLNMSRCNITGVAIGWATKLISLGIIRSGEVMCCDLPPSHGRVTLCGAIVGDFTIPLLPPFFFFLKIKAWMLVWQMV